jgi:hypothetical protein
VLRVNPVRRSLEELFLEITTPVSGHETAMASGSHGEPV